jgi:hypothetical protein
MLLLQVSPSSAATLPEWAMVWLPVATAGLAIALALRILVGVYRTWVRRTYRLRQSETDRDSELARPTFLEPDPAARRDALARGDAYAAEREAKAAEAARGETPPSAISEPGWAPPVHGGARIVALLAALVVLILSFATAASLTGTGEEGAMTWRDAWSPVFDQFWAGLAAAAVLLIYEVWQRVDRKSASAG